MAERSDHRCGPAYGNASCGARRCCSAFGWCGDGEDHCVKYKGFGGQYDGPKPTNSLAPTQPLLPTIQPPAATPSTMPRVWQRCAGHMSWPNQEPLVLQPGLTNIPWTGGSGVSEVDVPIGWTVILHEGLNGTGNQKLIIGPSRIPCLVNVPFDNAPNTNMNDSIRSITVYQTTSAPIPSTTQPPVPPPTTQPPTPSVPTTATTQPPPPPPSTTQPPAPTPTTLGPLVTMAPYSLPPPMPPPEEVTVTPAPPGLTVKPFEFNPVDQAYCIPLTKTDQPVEFCSRDFNGWGYDPGSKQCILATCEHTFGARYRTKQDCETACKSKIDATDPPQPARNDRLPVDYLVEPNVCVLINAHTWMKEGLIQVLTLPLKGVPSVRAFEKGSMAQIFSVSEVGEMKSLEGRTLRFQDSDIRFWRFKPYSVRDLGPLAYQLEQKGRNLARSATQVGMVTGVDAADSFTLLDTWFVVPIGQL